MSNSAVVERIRLPATHSAQITQVSNRFRGFFPIIVDIETSGFEPRRHAILEIGIAIPTIDDLGRWQVHSTKAIHVEPFPGAEFDATSLAFNKIDPFNPFRRAAAVSERDALEQVFESARSALTLHSCTRAVWVGHNVAFDLGFLNAAASRTKVKKNPFHGFTAFDTATLSALILGETVLAKALRAAGFDWDNQSAHSALYDAERTAQLFCWILNRLSHLTALDRRDAAIE
jgi:ribonuclease T